MLVIGLEIMCKRRLEISYQNTHMTVKEKPSID